ncbi:MAG: hypothetical protein NT016_01090 [Candidatus Aenigmarchaeota archaeon]|nr:hypothetical protein [Candidatus Aenigmarchaeota archaeon]
MEKLRETYKNMPVLDAELQAKLDGINSNLGLIDAAATLFDAFGVAVVGYGIYKRISDKDASAEKAVTDILARYRAEIAVLRSEYEKERDDFLSAQLKKLGQA